MKGDEEMKLKLLDWLWVILELIVLCTSVFIIIIRSSCKTEDLFAIALGCFAVLCLIESIKEKTK